MKLQIAIAVLLLSAFTASESATPTCVILKRASNGDHPFSGIEFYYLEGQYPAETTSERTCALAMYENW
jgi:hypothetical protein